MYLKAVLIDWLCLLIFGIGQLGHAEVKIYYVRAGDAFWEKTLWRMDANGNNKELVLKPPVPLIAPALSPDGQHLLFATKKVGGEEASKLMVMNLDGSNLQKLLAAPSLPRVQAVSEGNGRQMANGLLILPLIQIAAPIRRNCL